MADNAYSIYSFTVKYFCLYLLFLFMQKDTRRKLTLLTFGRLTNVRLHIWIPVCFGFRRHLLNYNCLLPWRSLLVFAPFYFFYATQATLNPRKANSFTEIQCCSILLLVVRQLQRNKINKVIFVRAQRIRKYII